jgi:hypothetical protein
LRRARWSLVGGRGCEHAGPRRQPRMDRATATRAYPGVLGRAALPPSVLTPAVPHMPKPCLCRRRQLREDRHDQFPLACRFRRRGRNYACHLCDHRAQPRSGPHGFPWSLSVLLSSGFPSKIKQSIFVDDAGGDPHDCTALSSAAVAPASHAAAAALCRSIAAWIGSVACAASVGRAPATVTAAVDAAMAPRIDLLLRGLPVDCGTSIADVFVGGVLCTRSALAIWIDLFVVRVRAGAED